MTDYTNKIQDEKLKDLRVDFNKLQEHHNHEMELIRKNINDIHTDMGGMKTDISWIKWLVQLAVGAAISSVVIGVINLLAK